MTSWPSGRTARTTWGSPPRRVARCGSKKLRRRHLQAGGGPGGLPHRLRFHDLRHTCASLLIAQGASVKAIQAQLGHASATVTLDRYGHLFPDELQQLADRLQDAHAEAMADPARTEPAETMLRQRKGAGQ